MCEQKIQKSYNSQTKWSDDLNACLAIILHIFSMNDSTKVKWHNIENTNNNNNNHLTASFPGQPG